MKKLLISAAVGLAGAASGIAQNITVFVNGEPVQFTGAGPQQLNGRVLVPLRGVMEKLGAYVSYQPEGKVVTATKGDVDLELRLGQRIARVNGRDVTLDVPAQEFRGSTMVPLRFMSEALGADVRWDSQTYSVMITTGATTGTANQPIVNNPPVTVTISSFDVDAPRSLRAGSRMNFTLVGTPGGTATVQIPGVTGEIQLVESEAGRYTGSFTIPNDDSRPITVSKASIIGRLRVGTTDRLIQSGNSIAIDSELPRITAVTPEENGRVTRMRPNITAVFDDRGGTGIDPTTIRMLVDGRDITSQATATSNLVVYQPTSNLAPGRHDVEIIASDRAGNPVNRRWSFTVDGEATVIRSFTVTGPEEPRPGDELTFTLLGQAGGQATFSIGDRVTSRSMREVEPGKYVANYTIRRGDRFQKATVVAKLQLPNGEAYTAEANRTLGIAATPATLTAPKLTTPTADDIRSGEVMIEGTAEPGSRVQIRVDYVQTVLGAFRTTGTVADLVVDVDERGHFRTRAIDLDTGLGRSNVTYNVTAVTVGANDVKSEAAKMSFKG